MPKVAHIRVYGDIAAYDPNRADNTSISLHNIKAQLAEFGKYDSIDVHIMSRGGEVSEGYAIRSYLTSLGVPVNTYTEGLCASIATVIQQSACNGGKRYMNKVSQNFIHNPWGVVEGDAAEVSNYASQLKQAEDELLNFYVVASQGKADKDKLRALMAEQTDFTPEMALEMGFIDEIIEPKVYASLKTENNLTQIISEMNKTIQAFIDKYKPKTAIKAIQETAADGTVIFIDAEAVATGANVYVGTDNTGDMLPTGDYTLSDGTIINVTDGVITGIVDVETMDALKAEIETLKAQLAEKEIVEVALEAADAVVAEKEAEIEAKQAEIVALKAQIKTNGKVATRNEVVASKSKADKEDRNKFEEAAERKAQYKSSRPTFN